MVEFLDMTAADLYSAVEAFPWFASARARLCVLTAENSGTEAAQSVLRDAIPYIPDCGYVASRLYKKDLSAYQDPDLELVPAKRPRIMMAGMDYFSREDYESAKKEEDSRLSRIAMVDYSTPAPEFRRQDDGRDALDLVTETLAEIYASQNHPETAIEIYRKLSLQNPEKSAYFASLIEKLNS